MNCWHAPQKLIHPPCQTVQPLTFTPTLILSSAWRSATSCSSRSFSAFRRMRALTLLAAQLRV